MVCPIDLILVPQGAEYKAISTGLRNSPSPPSVLAMPVGIKSVDKFLENQQFCGKRVLVMGLAGSLSPQHQVGDVIIYTSCSYIVNQLQLITKSCQSDLTRLLQEKLQIKAVKALTSDYVIDSAAQKQALGQKYDLTVVDMEGIAIVNNLDSVAMIRVISDGCDDDLPNLNSAINGQGKLVIWRMAIAFLLRPLSAIKLIKGSLKALKILEQVVTKIDIPN